MTGPALRRASPARRSVAALDWRAGVAGRQLAPQARWPAALMRPCGTAARTPARCVTILDAMTRCAALSRSVQQGAVQQGPVAEGPAAPAPAPRGRGEPARPRQKRVAAGWGGSRAAGWVVARAAGWV